MIFSGGQEDWEAERPVRGHNLAAVALAVLLLTAAAHPFLTPVGAWEALAAIPIADYAVPAPWRAAHGQTLSVVPDPSVTPGATNPVVTQGNIASTICVSGWTAKIRPSAHYTDALKRKQLAAGPYAASVDPRSVEEDHLISLEIGGNPTDPKNLWPEPWDGSQGAHAKDGLENALKKLVCSGRLSLDAAQTTIRTDWIAAYRKYVPVP